MVVDDPGKEGSSRHKILNTPLKIYIDGPFGSPSSNIYRAEHAVLVGTGIGVLLYKRNSWKNSNIFS